MPSFASASISNDGASLSPVAAFADVLRWARSADASREDSAASSDDDDVSDGARGVHPTSLAGSHVGSDQSSACDDDWTLCTDATEDPLARTLRSGKVFPVVRAYFNNGGWKRRRRQSVRRLTTRLKRTDEPNRGDPSDDDDADRPTGSATAERELPLPQALRETYIAALQCALFPALAGEIGGGDSEGLVEFLRDAFGMSNQAHMECVKELRGRRDSAKDAELLAQDLVVQMMHLENNSHPVYSMQAFPTKNTYDLWRHQEQAKIHALIGKFWAFTLPQPAPPSTHAAVDRHAQLESLIAKLLDRCARTADGRRTGRRSSAVAGIANSVTAIPPAGESPLPSVASELVGALADVHGTSPRAPNGLLMGVRRGSASPVRVGSPVSPGPATGFARASIASFPVFSGPVTDHDRCVRILAEFSLRHGVGDMQRHLARLFHLARRFENTLPHLRWTIAALRDSLSLLPQSQSRVTMTTKEHNMFRQAVLLLHAQVRNSLTRIKRIFPNNAPRGGVSSLIELLGLLTQADRYVGGGKSQASYNLDYVLSRYLKESFSTTYQRILTISLDCTRGCEASPVQANERRKQSTASTSSRLHDLARCPYTAAQLSLVVEEINSELEYYRKYYQIEFDGHFDLVALAGAEYYAMVCADVHQLCASQGRLIENERIARQSAPAGSEAHPFRQIDATDLDHDLLHLAMALHKLDSQWMPLFPDGSMTSWREDFVPIALQWVDSLSDRLALWIDRACEKDTWSPLMDSVTGADCANSSSVIDVVYALAEALRFVRSLDFLLDGSPLSASSTPSRKFGRHLESELDGAAASASIPSVPLSIFCDRFLSVVHDAIRQYGNALLRLDTEGLPGDAVAQLALLRCIPNAACDCHTSTCQSGCVNVDKAPSSCACSPRTPGGPGCERFVIGAEPPVGMEPGASGAASGMPSTATLVGAGKPCAQRNRSLCDVICSLSGGDACASSKARKMAGQSSKATKAVHDTHLAVHGRKLRVQPVTVDACVRMNNIELLLGMFDEIASECMRHNGSVVAVATASANDHKGSFVGGDPRLADAKHYLCHVRACQVDIIKHKAVVFLRPAIEAVFESRLALMPPQRRTEPVLSWLASQFAELSVRLSPTPLRLAIAAVWNGVVGVFEDVILGPLIAGTPETAATPPSSGSPSASAPQSPMPAGRPVSSVASILLSPETQQTTTTTQRDVSANSSVAASIVSPRKRRTKELTPEQTSLMEHVIALFIVFFHADGTGMTLEYLHVSIDSLVRIIELHSLSTSTLIQLCDELLAVEYPPVSSSGTTSAAPSNFSSISDIASSSASGMVNDTVSVATQNTASDSGIGTITSRRSIVSDVTVAAYRKRSTDRSAVVMESGTGVGGISGGMAGGLPGTADSANVEADLVAYGESLYKLLHAEASGPLVRDHRNILCTHRQTVSGAEVVSWMLSKGWTKTRASATDICSGLLRVNVIAAVTGDLLRFQDDTSLYRFTADDEKGRRRLRPQGVRSWIASNSDMSGGKPVSVDDIVAILGARRGDSAAKRAAVNVADLVRQQPAVGAQGALQQQQRS